MAGGGHAIGDTQAGANGEAQASVQTRVPRLSDGAHACMQMPHEGHARPMTRVCASAERERSPLQPHIALTSSPHPHHSTPRSHRGHPPYPRSHRHFHTSTLSTATLTTAHTNSGHTARIEHASREAPVLTPRPPQLANASAQYRRHYSPAESHGNLSITTVISSR